MASGQITIERILVLAPTRAVDLVLHLDQFHDDKIVEQATSSIYWEDRNLVIKNYFINHSE